MKPGDLQRLYRWAQPQAAENVYRLMRDEFNNGSLTEEEITLRREQQAILRRAAFKLVEKDPNR
jgi:hypothetical protein